MQSNLPHHIRRFRKAGLVVRRIEPGYAIASTDGMVTMRRVERAALRRLAWAVREARAWRPGEILGRAG